MAGKKALDGSHQNISRKSSQEAVYGKRNHHGSVTRLIPLRVTALSGKSLFSHETEGSSL